MNKTAFVLGLGGSIIDYIEKQPEGFTIGVNDVFKYHSVDELVCIDDPSIFKGDRRKIIEASTPKKFHSHLDSWSHVGNFNKIGLSGIRPEQHNILTSEKLFSSSTSTFVAVQIAARMGFKTIVMYGVDLTGHPKLDRPSAVPGIIAAYENLHKCLAFHGIDLLLGSNKSKLILPIWE